MRGESEGLGCHLGALIFGQHELWQASVGGGGYLGRAHKQQRGVRRAMPDQAACAHPAPAGTERIASSTPKVAAM